jgi:uncharacterized membrane protein YcaP (DUF421 family)
MEELFRFDVSPWEMIVRGSAMYWFLFALFRFVLRRDVGSLAIADVLLVVLIADAAQNGMSGTYNSISSGVVLVATIAAWNYLLDWASYRFEGVRRFVEPPPLLLIRDGRVMRANLRREMITVDELKAKLRQQGIEQFSEVKSAYMESDGEISAIRADGKSGTETQSQQRPAGVK